MISMLGKAYPNQEAKFRTSLLSGNNLKGERLVCTSTAMLSCGEQAGQLNPEGRMGPGTRVHHGWGPQNMASARDKTEERMTRDSSVGNRPCCMSRGSTAQPLEKAHLCHTCIRSD